MTAQKPGIIVYNKQALAGLDSKARKDISSWSSNHFVSFIDAQRPQSVTELLKTVKDRVKAQSDTLSVQGVRILILGMPNVGKSTLLNTLRHRSLQSKKAAKTGAQPGVTRSTKSIFKILNDPPAYIVDTPGIMVPFVPNTLTMLKLGLVHCIKESVLDPITLADYLLFELNRRKHEAYSQFYQCEPTNDIHVLLQLVGQKRGKLKKGGVVDTDAAAKQFVNNYRKGDLGTFCLDSVFPEALQRRVEEEGMFLSKSQIRRGAQVKTTS